MPYYDYRCESCDETFEVRRSMSESGGDVNPVCPACGERETRRVFGSFYAGTSGGETTGKT